MSGKEIDRYATIKRVLKGELTQSLAAAQLGVSVRQIKRLCRAVRDDGPAGLASKRRGHPSNRRIADTERLRIMTIVQEHYADFGPELATEYLRAEHHFTASTETLRQWMIQDGLWSAKQRRAKRIHSPRERRGCVGELVQIDGSHHAWFEERGPKCCLTAFIDDASGRILGARFSATETTYAYFDVLRECIARHGIPLALYSDRHSIFTKHDPEDPKPTQFERAALQLGIESICAHSPQAKGRVERLFQTLQDRLCKAMRLAHLSDMDSANLWLSSYIARHNIQFAVQPRDKQDAHRPCQNSAEALARICALHHQRKLSAQLSCQFEGRAVQVHPNQANLPHGRATVDIVQHANDSLELLYRGHVLAHTVYSWQDHLSHKRESDDKTVNDKVDTVVSKAQKKIARLSAQIEMQNAQRALGNYEHDTPANSPVGGGAREQPATGYALRRLFALIPRPDRADPPRTR